MMDSDHYYDSLWAEFLSGEKGSANSVEDTWTINQGWTTHQLWICRGPDFHSQHPCGLDSSQSPLCPATWIPISFSDLLWWHFTHPHKPVRRHRRIHAVLLKIVFKNPVSCLMLPSNFVLSSPSMSTPSLSTYMSSFLDENLLYTYQLITNLFWSAETQLSVHSLAVLGFPLFLHLFYISHSQLHHPYVISILSIIFEILLFARCLFAYFSLSTSCEHHAMKILLAVNERAIK